MRSAWRSVDRRWAITMCWLSPPEVTEALAPTGVNMPIGIARISASTAASRAASHASSRGGVVVVRDNVVQQILWMEPHILRHRTDLAPYLLDVEVLQIASVIVHRSGRRPVQAEREPEQRALAGARPAGTCMNRDLVQDQRPVGVVTEALVVEPNIAAKVLDEISTGVPLQGFGKEGLDLPQCRHDRGDPPERCPRASDRRLEDHEHGVGGEEVSDRDGLPVRQRQDIPEGRLDRLRSLRHDDLRRCPGVCVSSERP